jgi:hypothetical protein
MHGHHEQDSLSSEKNLDDHGVVQIMTVSDMVFLLKTV